MADENIYEVQTVFILRQTTVNLLSTVSSFVAFDSFEQRQNQSATIDILAIH